MNHLGKIGRWSSCRKMNWMHFLKNSNSSFYSEHSFFQFRFEFGADLRNRKHEQQKENVDLLPLQNFGSESRSFCKHSIIFVFHNVMVRLSNSPIKKLHLTSDALWWDPHQKMTRLNFVLLLFNQAKGKPKKLFHRMWRSKVAACHRFGGKIMFKN